LAPVTAAAPREAQAPRPAKAEVFRSAGAMLAGCPTTRGARAQLATSRHRPMRGGRRRRAVAALQVVVVSYGSSPPVARVPAGEELRALSVRDDREWICAREALTALTVPFDTHSRAAMPLLHTFQLSGGDRR
jgi:hypothetical protein